MPERWFSDEELTEMSRPTMDRAIEALDRTTFDEVVDAGRGVSEALSIACVGPHSADDFS